MTLYKKIASCILMLLIAVSSLAAPAFAFDEFTLLPGQDHKIDESVILRCERPGAQDAEVFVDLPNSREAYVLPPGQEACKIRLPEPEPEQAVLIYARPSSPESPIQGITPAPQQIGPCERVF